jgi:hypothetical protein
MWTDLDQILKQVFALAIATGTALGASPAVLAAGNTAMGTLGATRLELNVPDELVRILELPANRLDIIGARYSPPCSSTSPTQMRQCARWRHKRWKTFRPPFDLRIAQKP